MKNTHSIVTGVLAIAVIILFILQLSGGKKGGKSKETADTSLVTKGVVRIKYVRMDSLSSGYQLAIDLTKKFEEDNTIREQKFQQRQAYFQSKMKKYESDMYQLTQGERAAREEELGQLQQQIMAEGQELQNLAAAQNQQMSIQLEDSLINFFQGFASEVNADLILSTNTIGSNILYINPALDVTNKALKGLNERYNKSKPKDEGDKKEEEKKDK
jgi:outer membrane protein